MMKGRNAFLSLILTAALGLIACSDSGTKPAANGQPGVEEAVSTAVDAYIYGYPLVTRIAGSLCRLIDDPVTRMQAPIFLLDAHIDGINAAVRSKICDVDHPVGKTLVEALERRDTELAEQLSRQHALDLAAHVDRYCDFLE